MSEAKYYEIGITFHPKPEKAVVCPCPVLVDMREVGTLLNYDHTDGTGTASILGSLSMPEIVRLTVADYGYKGLDIKPIKGQSYVAEPDMTRGL